MEPDHFPFPTSPFQRRYQVFVSSTYEDLKEERRHVIQSLLESKCIPAGMELFPAASTEQWNLIKRVIDESDYYIVIVAGRYGSRGANGRSFTEMEFDYAVEIGKPVIGFYHENIGDLPGARLEKTDAGRDALAAFTEKVKSKLCRSWRNAEALGSAIKSAVFNEIEFNPQPGWVRASSQADPALVLKLKQRVVDLEAQIADVKSRAKKGQLAPAEDEVIEVEMEIELQSETPDSKYHWRFDTKLERRSFQIPWPILFAPLGVKLKKSRSETDIGGMFRDATIEYSKFDAGQLTPEGYKLKSVRILKEVCGKILDRLVADKIIQEVQPGKRDSVRRRLRWFRLTSKGIHFAATLRASSSPT